MQVWDFEKGTEVRLGDFEKGTEVQLGDFKKMYKNATRGFWIKFSSAVMRFWKMAPRCNNGILKKYPSATCNKLQQVTPNYTKLLKVALRFKHIKMESKNILNCKKYRNITPNCNRLHWIAPNCTQVQKFQKKSKKHNQKTNQKT